MLLAVAIFDAKRNMATGDVKNRMNSTKFWSVVTLIFVGFIAVAVLTHAAGFSLAMGSLFAGTNTLGKTLEGQGLTSGSTTKATAG